MYLGIIVHPYVKLGFFYNYNNGWEITSEAVAIIM